MLKRGKTSSVKNNAWFDVLKAWCPSEVVEEFYSLSEDGKQRMLDALKVTVMNTLTEVMSSFAFTGFGMVKTNLTASEKLLNRAVKSQGALIEFNHFDEVKKRLGIWGKVTPKWQALQENEQIYLATKYQQDSGAANKLSFYSSDSTVTKAGVKGKDTSNMRKILIKDLQLFETSNGCYIQGTLVGNPRMMVGLTTMFEDDDGNVIQIGLYNIIPQGPHKCSLAENMFPLGLKIKIVEPFMKIFRDGHRGIRVDDPSEVCIIKEQKQDIGSIRKRGKELMDLGEYLMAFEVYYNGVRSLVDTAIPLLNNKSQAEIKLEQYEDALLDAAAVLFFRFDKKAQQRYHYALEHIGSNHDDDSSKCIWIRVLKEGITMEKPYCGDGGSKEVGNELYAAGKYEDAKLQYSSALAHPDICLLLTNVAIACIKLNMFQTAISASSACLRISNDDQRRQKAINCISRSFLMLGEPELYKICSTKLHDSDELKKMLEIVNNCESIFYNTVKACCTKFNFKATVYQANEFCAKSDDLVCDLLKTKTVEHVYIDGKGRGIKATRDIKWGELILIDHPVACKGVDIMNTGFLISTNCNTKLMNEIGQVNLVTKILNLIKYDGILAKKLMSLERRIIDDGNKLPLVDLNYFGYRKLSYEVLPFLPQTTEILGVETCEINESFIQSMLDVNCFEYDAIDKDLGNKGSALCLRISLLNHSSSFNCRVTPYGESLVVYAKEDITKGCELTIQYNEYNDVSKWGIKDP